MASSGLLSGRVALAPSSFVQPERNGNAGAEATRPRSIERFVVEVFS